MTGHRTGTACDVSMELAKKAVKDWPNRDQRKQWHSLSGLKKAKTPIQGVPQPIRKGVVAVKQKPAAMGARTIHRTLSPKRTPFKTGI
jgi:hypothetical protein